jgi:ESCRT-I complex subunit TSG101
LAVYEKSLNRFNDLIEEKQAELDTAQCIHDDLKANQDFLSSQVLSGMKEIDDLNSSIAMLQKACSDMATQTRRRELLENTPIEDVVVTPTPLHHQILQLHSQELAAQDLVYYLSEGLSNKTVKLDAFLKQMRSLSKKQFYLRASILLARERANLAS